MPSPDYGAAQPSNGSLSSAKKLALSNGAETLSIPVTLLEGAKVIANSYSVILDQERHFSVETHTRRSWDNPPVPMGDIPRMLVSNSFSTVTEPAFRHKLEGLHRTLIENTQPNVVDVIHLDTKIAYLIFSEIKSTLLLADRERLNAFTQVTIYGMTRDEIEDYIVRGLGP